MKLNWWHDCEQIKNPNTEYWDIEFLTKRRNWKL